MNYFFMDIRVAFGITKANPQFGNGGLPQMFIPEFKELLEQGKIKKVEDKEISLENSKITIDQYFEIMDKVEEMEEF